MSFPVPIPEPVARALAKVGPELVGGVVELIGRVVRSPSPADTLARALQVTAHEQGADAAIDAAFAAKRKVVGTGE
jgi:hypothetical protein